MIQDYDNAIELLNVKKRFSNFQVQIPSLKIRKGYITGLIGQNGAGKTTVIKLIMNMLFCDDGTITVLGKDSVKDEVEIKQNIGYVGEKSGYFQESRLNDLKKVVSRFYYNWDEDIYKHYMDNFELDEKKKYKELSQGQQKRFNMLMALSHHPKLLIMDEPTSSLDPLARDEFLGIFSELMKDEQMSILYSTHITSDLEKAADYIVFIDNGKVLMESEKYSLTDGSRIIKGERSLLSENARSKLHGYKETAFGFEGLCMDYEENKGLFSGFESFAPTIEDIFIFNVRGDK